MPAQKLRVGMVGMGMIFDETYRPFFEVVTERGLWDHRCGPVEVTLAAVATRTGSRAARYLRENRRLGNFANLTGPDAVQQLIGQGVNVACIASPDDRHFEAARDLLQAGVHVLIEKPSVLTLSQLDELWTIAQQKQLLAKVVYHKLLDPDHKKLRTFVHDGVLQHVNHGYCSLLEPRSIATGQFAEWIRGRNPATYVAVHYIKLIDFTFGGRLKSVTATGQRGIVGPLDGPTWDSVQLRLTYEYADQREAAFDIHTSWVTPDDFPGYVEQEVQFRFDNGVWNGHSRKRGVECCVAGRTPHDIKITMNNHYNGQFLEPWGERMQRGYGIETIEQFFREAAVVEFGGPLSERAARLSTARQLTYNDLTAERPIVAAVQAIEAILSEAAAGRPHAVVQIDPAAAGLTLSHPGDALIKVLYQPPVYA